MTLLSQFMDILSWAALISGALLCVIGAIGLLRMPDLYTRMHAASVTETGGAGLILFGLMLQSTLDINLIKLIFILVFLLFTAPTATHALAQAALADKHKPQLEPARSDKRGRS